MPTPTVTVSNAVTHEDPYPFYAKLITERPFGQDAETGIWVAAGAVAVSAVLADPACRVRPADSPVPQGIAGTPAGAVFGNLVRMTDGEPQTRLKRIVAGTLGTIDEARVRSLAAEHAARILAVPGEPWARLQFGLPATVVATLCGLDADGAAEAAALAGDFVRCIPASATPADNTAAAGAAGRLLGRLGPYLRPAGNGILGSLHRAAEAAGWRQREPLLANGVGLLSQTYDATAGLIGNALLALGREGTPDDLPEFVLEVARHDAPIQNTRRFTAAPFRFAGQEVPAGSAILLLLAAANRDPAANPDPDAFRPDRRDARVFTFGEGRHGCPGRALAVAITAGVLDVLIERSSAAVLDSYRPSPNARIPNLRTNHG